VSTLHLEGFPLGFLLLLRKLTSIVTNETTGIPSDGK
jgi:hypothetical protein